MHALSSAMAVSLLLLALATPLGAAQLKPLQPEPAPAPTRGIGPLAERPYPSHFLDPAGLAALPAGEADAYMLGLLDGLLLGPDAAKLGWDADALTECLAQ